MGCCPHPSGSSLSLRAVVRICEASSVGYDETNLPQQQLAYNAPLAAAVMGLPAGEMAEDLLIGSRCWDIEVLALYPDRQQAQGH